MKSIKKLLIVVLFSITFICLFGNMNIRAKERPEEPIYSIKKINKGTGVIITIEKTLRADGYLIKLQRDNNYNNYTYNEFDNNIAEITEDGSEVRTFTMNGLPKGTYTFCVRACQIDEYGDLSPMTYGKRMTVKIKGVKTEVAKEKKYNFKKAKVGDIVKFGSYEQDDNMLNGKEDIEWIVLSKTKSKMLLLSKDILDWVSYNYIEDYMFADLNVTWENCTLRKWLNGYFYKTAFTDTEKKMIKKCWLKNNDNPMEGTEGGNDTKDRIFLLSTKEVTNKNLGFEPERFRNILIGDVKTSEYALMQGGYYYKRTTYDYSRIWWLRTPGVSGDRAVYILGEISCIDNYFMDSPNEGLWTPAGLGVRPALFIEL